VLAVVLICASSVPLASAANASALSRREDHSADDATRFPERTPTDSSVRTRGTLGAVVPPPDRGNATLSDNINATQGQENVTFASDGAAYAVWVETPPGQPQVSEVKFSRQDPVTGVWGATERVNDVLSGGSCYYGASDASMAVDGSNNVYVVWDECRTGDNKDVFFSKRSAATGQWSASVRVNDATDNPQWQPWIAVSSTGAAVAVWFDQRGGGNKKNVYSARLAVGGSTWSTNLKITSDASASKGAAKVKIGPDGTAYAVWNDNRTNNVADVWFSSLPSGSSTWSTNTKISATSSFCGTLNYPDIAVDGSSNLTVIWNNCYPTPTAYATRRLSGSSTWTNSVVVGTGLDIGGRLAVRSDGRVLAAFAEYVGSRVFGAEFQPLTNSWSTPQAMASTSGGLSVFAAVAASDTRSILGYSSGSPRRLSWQPFAVGPAHLAAPVGTEHNPPDPNGGTGGDPVGTFTGTFSYTHLDAKVAGRGPAIEFERSYNSNDARSGSMGPGWIHSYQIRLDSPGADTPDLILVGPQGRSDRYVRTGSTFSAPAGVYRTLVHNWNGTYTAIDKSRTAWSFDSAGRLTRIQDRYGNASSLTYDGIGQLASVSDPAGRGSLTLGYANGLLTTVTDWASPARVITYTYDGAGRLWKVTDREGKTTIFAYDGTSSRLASITDPRGHVGLTLSYDAQGRVASQKDARGLATGDATSFGYVINQDGTRVTSVTHPATSFEPTFQPTVVDTYSANGWLSQRVDRPSSAETLTESYTYDAAGNRTSITDARGKRTDFCFDVSYAGSAITPARGALTRTIEPPPAAGQVRPVTLMLYDSTDNLVQTVSPKGVPSGSTVTCSTNLSAITTTYATDFGFDLAGVLMLSKTTRFTDPDTGLVNAVTKYEYGDAANPGLVTRAIPPRGNAGPSPDYAYATTFTYYATGTQAGLLQQVGDPLGNHTTYDYDGVGRPTSSVDPLGNAVGGVPAEHRTTYAYDKENRLRFVTQPPPSVGGNPITTETRYDEVGNVVVRIDANGQVTTYGYDERDGLLQVKESPSIWTDPASPPAVTITTEYAYDAAENMTRMIRAKGDATCERATDYAYDGRNLVRSERQYPSWPATSGALVTTTTYDPTGNRASVVDPQGQNTAYGYDDLRRLTTIDYSSVGTADVAYGYDANGNRTSMTDGTGATTYVYDESDRLLSVTSPGSTTVGFRYDRDGNRTKVIYPDATSVGYTFDRAERLASLTDWASRSVSYSYLADGAPETATFPNGTVTTYVYDNTRRMTEIRHALGGTDFSDHEYGLDGVGNVTSLTEGTNAWTYTYDRMYRLTGVTGADGPRSYGYDPAGNRTSAGATAYTYDRTDRMTAAGAASVTVDAKGNLTARGADTFAFNQANRLTSATVGATTESYTYDGDGNRATRQIGGSPAIQYVTDPTGRLPLTIADGTRKYIYGLGLAYVVNGNAIEIVHPDRLGSIRAITDATGVVTATYRYDEWGTLTVATGSSTQPFAYTGELHDLTGLTYLRARYEDPSLGRFLSRDPIAGNPRSCQTLNRYSYVLNNPVTLVDPTGRKPQVLRNPDDVARCAGAATAEIIGGAATGSIEVFLVRAAIGGAIAGPAGVASAVILTLSLLAVDTLLERIREQACDL
jgi:RHS repeat-associated protein